MVTHRKGPSTVCNRLTKLPDALRRRCGSCCVCHSGFRPCPTRRSSRCCGQCVCFVFHGSPDVVAGMLGIGVATAIIESRLTSRSRPCGRARSLTRGRSQFELVTFLYYTHRYCGHCRRLDSPTDLARRNALIMSNRCESSGPIETQPQINQKQKREVSLRVNYGACHRALPAVYGTLPDAIPQSLKRIASDYARFTEKRGLGTNSKLWTIPSIKGSKAEISGIFLELGLAFEDGRYLEAGIPAVLNSHQALERFALSNTFDRSRSWRGGRGPIRGRPCRCRTTGTKV
jgi:hypothetical protein